MVKAKYKVVVETLRNEILSGKWTSHHSRFPSERALMRRFNVSRPTISMALQELHGQGYVLRRQGKGTFLTKTALQASGAIAVVVPSFPRVEIFPVICRELSRICQEHNRLFLYVDQGVMDVESEHAAMRQSAERLVKQGVSGVIFRPMDYLKGSSAINRDIVALFQSAGIPVVLVDSDIGEEDERQGLDLVGVDNFEVGALLGRHAVECGARRVVYVFRAQASKNVDQRVMGIRSVIGQTKNVKLVGVCQQSDECTRWIAQLQRMKPDALLCSGDIVAAKAMKGVQDLGWRIPEDVIVAGVDDVEISRVTRPSLTTVRQPCVDIAQAAFDMLEWRLHNPLAAARTLHLGVELVRRGSTAQMRKGK